MACRFRPEARRGADAREQGPGEGGQLPTRPAEGKADRTEPGDDDGNFAPYDLWGHDVMWWLDKMVRSNQPLVERMALNWHDWFATGDVGSARISIDQANLFRKKAFERFDKLILKVTIDPAMLIWLSGIDNNRWYPNENYGRELMELFTLGVSDETGYPYSEDDVREQARALTGWRADWEDDVGYVNFRFDPRLPRQGNQDDLRPVGQVRLARTPAGSASSTKLTRRSWSESSGATSSRRPRIRPHRPPSRRMYRRNYEIKPLLKAILKHPTFYEGPSMVKPPIVYIAGMLRARERGVDRDELGLDLGHCRASGPSARQTSRAGTRSAGSTRRAIAVAGSPPPTSPATTSSTRASTRRTRRRKRPSTRRSATGATP